MLRVCYMHMQSAHLHGLLYYVHDLVFYVQRSLLHSFGSMSCFSLDYVHELIIMVMFHLYIGGEVHAVAGLPWNNTHSMTLKVRQ